ncbi:MAG: PTS fructose transporter subunit IIC [Mycoplasmatales bacterium]
MKILAITSCAAGIAHTYMAAESIEVKAKELGHEIKVETQGTIGKENELTAKEIKAADLIIIAAEVHVELDRFIGKRVYITDTKLAIANPEQLIANAHAEATVYTVKGAQAGDITLGKTQSSVIKHLMNGISYMMPMVIAAGLLLAIANVFAFSADDTGKITQWGWDVETSFGLMMSKMFAVGQVGFKLMIPLFAGFVAVSIADRPALAPAMIGAYLINDPEFLGTEAGAGFLGAIVIGFFVGYLVKYLKKIPWPKIVQPLVPIMIIPLIATFIVFIVSFYLIGPPISIAMKGLYDGMTYITDTYTAAPFIVGAIFGAAIGFDLGGPVNKTALIVGTAIFTDTVSRFGIEGANFIPGTATQAAISVAPLGAWLATILYKKYYASNEKVLGNNAAAMGMVGISEGAIPFAASKPLVYIPANVIGSAVAGGLVSVFGLKFYGGIGSPLGTFIGYIGEQPIPYLTWIFCVMSGVVVTALLIGVGLKISQKKQAKLDEELVKVEE